MQEKNTSASVKQQKVSQYEDQYDIIAEYISQLGLFDPPLYLTTDSLLTFLTLTMKRTIYSRSDVPGKMLPLALKTEICQAF